MLIYDVLHDGLGRISWAFLTSEPSRRAEAAGIYTAIVGSVYVIGLTAIIAVPLGVGAAIHLEEYGTRGRLSKIIEINISNLAGVPSIIYGLLGLGLFVRAMGMGPSVLAGASTLALLALPVVIISTREALRAVPKSLREGSYALGATKWQTIWYQVLPAAFPGMLTGSDPGAVAGDRRNGAARHDRRADLRSVPAGRHLVAVHRAADSDLRVGLTAAGGLCRERGRRHHRPARPAAGDERDGDRAARSVPEEDRLEPNVNLRTELGTQVQLEPRTDLEHESESENS